MKKITIEAMARIRLTLGTDGKIYLIVEPRPHSLKPRWKKRSRSSARTAAG